MLVMTAMAAQPALSSPWRRSTRGQSDGTRGRVGRSPMSTTSRRLLDIAAQEPTLWAGGPGRERARHAVAEADQEVAASMTWLKRRGGRVERDDPIAPVDTLLRSNDPAQEPEPAPPQPPPEVPPQPEPPPPGPPPERQPVPPPELPPRPERPPSPGQPPVEIPEPEASSGRVRGGGPEVCKKIVAALAIRG
jgi:hypothetical protein